MTTRKSGEITVHISKTSIGEFRRTSVLSEVFLHSRGESAMPIGWKYRMNLVKDALSLTAAEPPARHGLFVGALPAVRHRHKHRQVGDVFRISSILGLGSSSICSVCGTILENTLEEDLERIAVQCSEEILLLALNVTECDQTSFDLRGISHRSLVDMLSIERVIGINGEIRRPNVEGEPDERFNALVLDTVRGSMLVSNLEQIERWKTLSNHFGLLHVYRRGSQNLAEFVSMLYSPSFCKTCNRILDEQEIDKHIGGLAESDLGGASLKEAHIALHSVSSCKDIGGLIQYLCDRGLGDIHWGDTVATLDDRSFVIWHLLFILSTTTTAPVFCEGLISHGLSVEDIQEACRLTFNEKRRVVVYDVHSQGLETKIKNSREPLDAETLIEIALPSPSKLDCLGSMSGVLKVAAPLYAATKSGRIAGFGRSSFLLDADDHLCAVCDGSGYSPSDKNIPCLSCRGLRITESLGEVEYYGVTFARLLGSTLEELLFMLQDPQIHAVVSLLVAHGFGSARLTDSWHLFDVGELTRMQFIRKYTLLTNKQKRSKLLFKVPFFSWGLGMQGVQNTVDSLLEQLNPVHSIYAVDSREEVQKLLNTLLRGNKHEAN